MSHSNMPDRKPIALIGAPCDLGASQRGAARAPAALRRAGLAPALAAAGFAVNDRGDVAIDRRSSGLAPGPCRHLPAITAWCAAARDAVGAALEAGELPVMLGGDHSLAIGSIAAVARHCAAIGRPLAVLWLDAHADLNTPATTPSGNIHGMPAAVVCGLGHPDLLALGHDRPMVDPRRFVNIGARSIDLEEWAGVQASGVTLIETAALKARGMRATMAEALDLIGRDGAHLHVSFDVDFLDPAVAPGVGIAVPDGPGAEEAAVAMAMIRESGLLGSLDIVELNPRFDRGGRTARTLVALIETMFAARAAVGEECLAC
jgi:arginase